jgi:tetratricopeptide (TPR) repeat protein
MVSPNLKETAPIKETARMSILDGLPQSEAEVEKALALAAPVVERIFESMDLSPRQRSILELLKKGHSLADIYDLTQDERDAMFTRGCQLVQAGEFEKGRDWLMFVHQLDPRDARVVYVIALTYQMQGKFTLAAKLYVFFIALDASNPEGFLRLGECLLPTQDYAAAVDCFRFAKERCARRKDNAAAVEHAERMLAYARQKQAASGTAPNQIRHQ